MSGNTIGEIFKVTTFGESHGPALGCVIDGCPAGIPIDILKIQKALDKRKPGAKQIDAQGNEIFNSAVTARKEADKAEILSGIFSDTNNATETPLSTGTPIGILIRNTSQHSKDYSNLKKSYRPGHADYTYDQKYGFRDYTGGGRSSGRETAARVAAGAIAQMVLENTTTTAVHTNSKINIIAWTKEAAGVKAPEVISLNNPSSIDKQTIDTLQSTIETNSMRTSDTQTASEMSKAISKCRAEGNSAGGIIRCLVTNIPAGLGEPVFDKLDAELAKAMLSIGAIKGIEFGSGFESAKMHGSDWNDAIRSSSVSELDTSPYFETNHAGGILGGLSTGAPIIFDVVVKPVPSIFIKQHTIQKNNFEMTTSNTKFQNTDILIEGRHDICLCPRIVPVVEAMTAIVLADMLLRNRNARR
ncbi:MAG: chorismate synthase [Treponema sp. CETP13]|nr:MAG: chorismate synthase [Treponema sp. CETP13]